jgi:hypothetical protein
VRKRKYKYYLGIDPGVHTGIALYDSGRKGFDMIQSTGIIIAINFINNFSDKENLFVRVEDARKRKWFGTAGREQLQGAGSIKRDCQIWEEFLEFSGIAYEMVAPKNNKTKLDAKLFSKYTGWKLRTNEHGRDAAMLVYGI